MEYSKWHQTCYWTELTECVDSYLDASEGVANRKYFYMTFLREPVARYISEFLHVQRGATWKDSQYMCGGQPGLVTYASITCS